MQLKAKSVYFLDGGTRVVSFLAEGTSSGYHGFLALSST